MKTTKRHGLEDAYQKFIAVCTNENMHMENVDSILSENLVVLGTTADERVFSKSDFYTFIKRQAEQSQGLDMKWHISPIIHRVSNDENSAVFIDDLTITMTINSQPTKMDLRCSIVFEFQDNNWIIVHMHASKPEEAESDTDTFGIDQWKQKTIELEKIVVERTSDLIKKNKELETAMDTLKATQSQLIQSEKMASLGELTAGIAHEIQNPLNFVNNFSELSTELIDEMNEELDKGDLDEAKAISEDIKQNLEKINHHGKRADDIVKGMLQHSRKNTGEKELTDINKLTDEYLRLAYHGLRAKDKSFNATLETDFDPNLGKIKVVSQEIGRVVLNLFTNAFYACAERSRSTVNEKQSNAIISGYKPTVSVSTLKSDDTVKITIKDNGNGIPKAIQDKIFQPFFTTKPTGKGTGLGLSMSYDIIKAHGGELRVESEDKEGLPAGQAGTTFIVSLPIK